MQPVDSDYEVVSNAIGLLGSLVTGGVDPEHPIQPVHSSFYEFLLDESRSKVFFIDVSKFAQSPSSGSGPSLSEPSALFSLLSKMLPSLPAHVAPSENLIKMSSLSFMAPVLFRTRSACLHYPVPWIFSSGCAPVFHRYLTYLPHHNTNQILPSRLDTESIKV
ncbi:hypothetical protein K503DRAFT_767908 [Rhizopogon vinicolor AM-OR11-026]|uniref:Uncharacterized protein n=1 Tax=Rhizopogon vinicolor AM-OR11-026 TaxID=1314800 RepID=A0A1B7N8I3_9AGAM|nr:hypothetical protein K503DRAFT_767908 [Rhizopogon vinicolor AM-OR11-026]